MVEEAVEDIITLAMGNFHTSIIYIKLQSSSVCLSVYLSDHNSDNRVRLG